MAKKKTKTKFYAIRKGNGVKNIIVNTWVECSKLVLGYNAEYKSFKTEEEAENYLLGNLEIKAKNKSGSDTKNKEEPKVSNRKPIKIYLDDDILVKFNEKCSELNIGKNKAIEMLIDEWIN